MIFSPRRITSLHMWLYFCLAISSSTSVIGSYVDRRTGESPQVADAAATAAGSAQQQINPKIDGGCRLRGKFKIKDGPDLRVHHEDMMKKEEFAFVYLQELERQQKNQKDDHRNIAFACLGLLIGEGDNLKDILLENEINNIAFHSGCFRGDKNPPEQKYYTVIASGHNEKDKKTILKKTKTKLIEDISKEIPQDITTEETIRVINEITQQAQKDACILKELTIIQALPLLRPQLRQRLEASLEISKDSLLQNTKFDEDTEKALKTIDQKEITIAITKDGIADIATEVTEKATGEANVFRKLEYTYSHSEQLLIQYLNDPEIFEGICKTITQTIKTLQDPSKIAGIVMHLYTTNSPCHNCAVLLFRELERTGGFIDKLRNFIRQDLSIILLVSFKKIYEKEEDPFYGIEVEQDADTIDKEIDLNRVASSFFVIPLEKETLEELKSKSPDCVALDTRLSKKNKDQFELVTSIRDDMAELALAASDHLIAEGQGI